MSAPIPLFVELCAGTAALSLRLHRDGARPPVSRMGAKTGYADVILRILGLTPGQRAAAYLWCEPDPGVRLLLHAYRDAGLARAAAAIIRSWAAEDPRALWERLRAEGPPRLPDEGADAGEVARWAYLSDMAFRQGEPESGYRDDTLTYSRGGRGKPQHGAIRNATRTDALPTLPATIAPDARLIDPREVARYAQIVASNRLIHTAWSDAEGRWVNTGDGGATFGGPAFASPPERTAEGLDAAPADLPAVVAPDARELDPREVARWTWVATRSWKAAPEHGFKEAAYPVSPEHTGGAFRYLPTTPAHQVEANTGLPAIIAPDARTIDPPTLPPGTVAYMDPPYVNTTGYANDLPRAEVVTLARRWAAAGAIVAISEAEPIPELVTEGWHAVRIDAERVGNKRTFSKQQAEWLTLSQPPAWVPAVQASLFGGAR